MKVLVIWAAVVAAMVWSFTSKTAPLHAFFTGGSLGEWIVVGVVSVLGLSSLLRGENRALQQRGQRQIGRRKH